MSLTRPQELEVEIAADWDGCFDILFDEGIEVRSRDYAPYLGIPVDEVRQLLLQQQKILNDALTQITTGRRVRLVSGSYRQNHLLDRLGHEGNADLFPENDPNYYRGNRTGLSLQKLPALCQERGWEYNHLLYPDIQHKLEVGSAFRDATLGFTMESSERKLPIVKGHLSNISENHSGPKKVHYYFFDDTLEILTSLITHYKATDVPDNINMRFVKFNWHDGLCGKKSLVEMAYIPGGKKVLANIEPAQPSIGKVQSCCAFLCRLFSRRPRIVPEEVYSSKEALKTPEP